MRVESNQVPQKKYKIENHINGKVDVIFFDNIIEEEEKVIYDMYRITVIDRETIEDDISNNFDKWLEYAKKKEYDELAFKIRKKRDELLKETDAEMCLDRLGLELPEGTSFTSWIKFLKTIANVVIGNMAKYRQELRDITKQPGFPYNVEFPIKPTNEESEE